MVGTDNCYQHWLPSSLPDVTGDSQASPCLRNLGWAYPVPAACESSSTVQQSLYLHSSQAKEIWADISKCVKTALAKSEHFADGFWEGRSCPGSSEGTVAFWMLFSSCFPSQMNKPYSASLIVLSFSSKTFWENTKQKEKNKLELLMFPGSHQLGWKHWSRGDVGQWEGFLGTEMPEQQEYELLTHFQSFTFCSRCCVWDWGLLICVYVTAWSAGRGAGFGELWAVGVSSTIPDLTGWVCVIQPWKILPLDDCK